jgi:hypothetical protein
MQKQGRKNEARRAMAPRKMKASSEANPANDRRSLAPPARLACGKPNPC